MGERGWLLLAGGGEIMGYGFPLQSKPNMRSHHTEGTEREQLKEAARKIEIESKRQVGTKRTMMDIT